MMSRDQIEDAMIVHSIALDKLRTLMNLDHAVKNTPHDSVRKQARKNFDKAEAEYHELITEIKP